MEMGPIEQSIAKQAIQCGGQIPERIQNAPTLNLGLDLYMQAFLDLDSERSHGMGLTRIPWTSIKEYAIAYGFDEEQTADLLYIIPRMDQSHLKWLDSQKAD